jgi:hypothetical protein
VSPPETERPALDLSATLDALRSVCADFDDILPFEYQTLKALASALPGLLESAKDAARIEWLEAHDYSPTCYNVSQDRDHDRWAAPMKPNNGWVISITDVSDGERSDDDCHGNTLRDCIDWTQKQLARRASLNDSGLLGDK